MTLGGRETPEYRFGGPGMLIFEGKKTQKDVFLFSDRFLWIDL
jgi:hypothetical protein